MDIAFDESGRSGPVVVCLPMFGMTRAATAAAFTPAFAGAGLREVYPDLPGHGDSPAGCPAASQAVLDAVCAWLDRHVGAPVLLAGASYGAYLAAGIARQRPEIVRGLLLVCPGVKMSRGSRNLPEIEAPEAPTDWLDGAPPNYAHTLTRLWATAHRLSSRRCSRPCNSAGPATRSSKKSYEGALTSRFPTRMPTSSSAVRSP